MPVERVQFVVFEINTSVYLHQIAFVIMLKSKFLMTTKWANAIWSLWKKIFYKNLQVPIYLHQITIGINSSPINNLHDKGSQKVKTAHMLKMSTKKCLTDVVPYWQTLLRSMVGIHICQLFYLFILHRLV